jgi:hypothetical protein
VIRLLRVAVPAGARVNVIGVIPGVAGVRISTPAARNDPAESCERRSAVVVCTQSEEACPIPAATWRFQLRKLAGPAGLIRLSFVVGRGRS